MMRIVWIGFHQEGLPALEAVLAAGHRVAAVLTLKPDQAAGRSGAADYRPLCQRFGVPLHEIRNVNDADVLTLLSSLAPRVVFVIGWSQLVGRAALGIPELGMIGAHASFLPHNRGSAPVRGALIRGEKEAGNSLMWLAEGVDEGDLIDQVSFPITPFDTCATLYEKVAESNRVMILRTLPSLLAGERPGRKQPAATEPVLARRRPQDGLLNWSLPGSRVYDFVRGLTRPYPGAFTYLEGRPVKIWQAALLPELPGAGSPGSIVGPIHSPRADACGLLVRCGTGHVAVLEAECDGQVLAGRELAEIGWHGKVFGEL